MTEEEHADWEYYLAYVPPTSSPTNPRTVYRHPRGAHHAENRDEIFGRGGVWRTSDLRLRIWLGMEYWELQACSRAGAATVVRGMVERGSVSRMPEDLAG